MSHTSARIDPDDEAKDPQVIYHFTDLSGLIGIISSRELWATHFSAMNDPAEREYGLRMGRSLLQISREDASEPPRKAFFEEAIGTMEQLLSEKSANALAPFIVSFSPTVEKSQHWLHYGRSGRGFAIGFRGADLKRNNIIARVEYDRGAQLARLTEGLDDCYAQGGANCGTLGALVLHVLTYCLKHPAFIDENEWRLVTSTAARAMPRHFRVAGSRLIPYMKLPFDGTNLCEIVLGYSCEATELQVKLLLDEHNFEQVTVRRSEVPIR